MKNKSVNIDIRLERDPRYLAATARLTELKIELSTLEREKQDVLAGLSALTPQNNLDLVNLEAQALVTGSTAPDLTHLKRETMTKSLADMDYRISVHFSALEMQRGIVGQLRTEISRAICGDLLPQHKANVANIVTAALQLSVALQAQMELRDDLEAAGVEFSSLLRQMPINGFDLRDSQSKLSHYMLECHEYGFIAKADLPDIVRDRIPKPSKPIKSEPVALNTDGWLAA